MPRPSLAPCATMCVKPCATMCVNPALPCKPPAAHAGPHASAMASRSWNHATASRSQALPPQSSPVVPVLQQTQLGQGAWDPASATALQPPSRAFTSRSIPLSPPESPPESTSPPPQSIRPASLVPLFLPPTLRHSRPASRPPVESYLRCSHLLQSHTVGAIHAMMSSQVGQALWHSVQWTHRLITPCATAEARTELRLSLLISYGDKRTSYSWHHTAGITHLPSM